MSSTASVEKGNLKELATELNHPDIKKSENENFDIVGMTLKESLNALLADEYALFTKTLNYHWNVTGPRFYSVHEFLEEQYRALIEVVDDVAERIREVGGQPMGTLSEFATQTNVTERPGVYPDTSAMIGDLLEDHNLICGEIRKVLSDSSKAKVDPGSDDFLTGLLKKHEEMAWMLKSTLS